MTTTQNLPPLTSSQQFVLAYVALAIKSGLPPTRAEIGRNFGFQPNAAECYLRALERKGYIKLIPHVSRGIRLVEGIQP